MVVVRRGTSEGDFELWMNRRALTKDVSAVVEDGEGIATSTRGFRLGSFAKEQLICVRMY